MTKGFAIEMANKFSKRDNCKYYVVNQPNNYNEIFNNEGFKVTPVLNENNLASVVYVTE
jgi:uncharacterized membrane protein